MHSVKKLERILFTATEMEARGTNEYISYLAAELQRRGFRVAVFCAPGPMVELLESRGISVTTFEHLADSRLPSRPKAEFRKALEAFSPDIVHAPDLRAVKSYKRITGRLWDYPLIATMHSAPPRGRFFRSVAADLAGIVATSQKVREEMVNDFRFAKNKIAMSCNGIDVEALKREGDMPVFSRPVPVIGSVGPVERARGHELFIKAASILNRADKKVQFVIAGEGAEVPKLSKLGSQLGLDRCLTFVRDFASYHEILDAFDVVVQNAQVDVSGFSILDAMGSAKPVVAFSTGTACEIIADGKTGLIVPQDDAEALAGAMLELVEKPQWALSLGEEARRCVTEKFNIRKNAGCIVNFYHKILTGHD